MQIEMERITQGKTAFVTLPRSPEPGNPQHTTFHHPSETVAAGGFEGGAISQKPVLYPPPVRATDFRMGIIHPFPRCSSVDVVTETRRSPDDPRSGKGRSLD